MADGLVETSEQGHAYIKRFGVACSVIHSTNYCYRLIARISIILRAQNYPVALWEGDLSLSKVYEGPHPGLCGGKPFDFKQSFYTAL